MATRAYEELELLTFPERFVLRPLKAADALSLEIDRQKNNYSLVSALLFPEAPSAASSPLQKQKIFGCLGVIRLVSGPYLIIITQRTHVGNLRGNSVYRVENVDMIAFAPHKKLSSQHTADEQQYLSLLQSVVAERSFYYSYSYDLTSSTQRNASFASASSSTPASNSFWHNMDPHFLWNNSLLRDFVSNKLEGFIIPLIRGFVSINHVTAVNSRPFDFVLISRGSCRRAGTRLNMRGIDEQGDVANFAETEQIVIVGDKVASYVETRGSIPIYWTQYPNLRYKPKPQIEATASKDPKKAFGAHFRQQLGVYDKVTIVNLVDQKGNEKRLSDDFERSWKSFNNNNLKYVMFDFHKECSKMRYENLSILVKKVKEDMESMGYYYFDQSSKTKQTQSGVFRVNCIDCLDRTNVVQSLFAAITLQDQLKELGIFREGENIKSHPIFDDVFRNVWADNADAVSTLYSGTGALKTDYTRTGKRSMRGALNDGINSVVRYYMNNFVDGKRQDAINLWLGVFSVDAAAPTPFRSSPTKHQVLQAGLMLSVFLAFLTLALAPADGVAGYSKCTVVSFFIAVAIAFFAMIWREGHKFVSKPQLSAGSKKHL